MTDPTLKGDTVVPGPSEILQRLVRFDTTNPPGNERECVTYIHDLLSAAGLGCRLFAKDPDRPNLVARLAGRGNAAPLLVYGHVDVVTTAGQAWKHSPFGGQEIDGYVWGRGTLDMKGGIAMMLSALLRARREGLVPSGDVVLAVVGDEEAGGENGAKYLVEKHADQFEGVRYAIGEFGGVSLRFAERTLYPIQIAEKQVCWLKATLRGPGGHGALPMRGGAMAKLGRFLTRLDQRRLPVHVTSVTRHMIETLALKLPPPMGGILHELLDPALTAKALKMLAEKSKVFEPLLYNTVNATIVHGGHKINVVPTEIVVELDTRLLPTCSPEDVIAELRVVVGDDVAIDVERYDGASGEPDMGLYELLATIIGNSDPEGIPVPWLIPGATDGRHFHKLGIQSYGFTPMKLPPDFDYFSTIHAADERVPVKALEFGADALYRLLQVYGADTEIG